MKKLLEKIIFYWFLAGEIIPNVILSFTEPLTVMGSITNILLPLGILGLIASSSKNIGRTVWLMLLYTVFAAFQIVCLSLYGRGIISVDMFLNVLTTNCMEVYELLSRLWTTLLFLVFLYLVPLAAGAYSIYRHRQLSEGFLKLNRKIWSVVTLLGLIGLGCCYGQKSGYEARLDLYPVNIGYNLWLTKTRCDQTNHYFETSADYKYNSQRLHDEEIEEKYIIVLGETSRAANWEILGYDRATNPHLKKRNNLIAASRAYSESNTTHKSVPMLLSSVDAHTFDTDLVKVKSLITAFKEAGFHTAFISNQMPNHSFIDFFGAEADTTVFVKTLPEIAVGNDDDVLIPFVKDCLDLGKKKQLIVVHTYGSHFNYRDRYSEADRVFLPDNFSKASKAYRQELLNAYDNSIVATDRLVDSMIEMLDNGQCVSGLFYTSDHGEDIFDDGKHFLHASPYPTEYQLHVPLLVWLSPEYIAQYPGTESMLRANSGKKISTSRSFCPTVLSVGGIKTDKVNSQDDLCSRDYSPKNHCYLNDHDTPLPFESAIK